MDERRCKDCNDKVYQCWRCKKDDDDARKALKAIVKLQKKAQKKKPEPSADELKQGRFLEIMRKQFVVKDIARDGNCCFTSFAAGYFKLSGIQVQSSQLRNEVADFLIESKGLVPGMVYDHFEKNEDGEIVTSAVMETKRNVRVATKTLQQYADSVRKSLYGGDLEVAVLAHLYKVQVRVYCWQFYHDHNVFHPQYFGDICCDRCISLLWEQDFHGKHLPNQPLIFPQQVAHPRNPQLLTHAQTCFKH